MKTTIFALFTGAAAAQLSGAPLGYQDTPLIPGTAWHVHDGNRPQPAIVVPGTASTPEKAGAAPSDAIVLFDGSDLARWKKVGGEPAPWKVEDGYMEVSPKGDDIFTRDEFGPDVQLHLEFRTPTPAQGDSQGRGNSGVFFYGVYEIQVLDCYQNLTYADGTTSAIYAYQPPLVNACRPPGEWQTYDIIFEGPRFKEGKLEKAAFATVLLNGVLTQNHVALIGQTAHRQVGTYKPHGEKGPIKLQDHNNPTRFRNIWIRELRLPGPAELGDGPKLEAGKPAGP